MTTPSHLRLATRGSALALAQSRLVAAALERAHTGLSVALSPIVTTGDRIQDRPLYDVGGKGLFTKEVEQALLRGEADIAVHSFKDMPVTMPLVPEASRELVVASVPARADARDVLVSPGGGALADLPEAARVGTTSPRRRAQLLSHRPDLSVLPLRGNVETRLARLAAGEWDAIVLALAGLSRLGRFDAAQMRPMDPTEMIPAAGQGALALQCRRDDEPTRRLLAALDDAPTRVCVDVERGLVAALEGDCRSPIGAWATLAGGGVVRLLACDQTGGVLRRSEVVGSAVEVIREARAALRPGS